jgi:gamma-glutamyl hercynylcysteine S-oxide synthase
MHVSFHEAEAFARWAGARLPTEPEWERAAGVAGGEPGNLDQLDFGPGPAGPFVGDCWEWTASGFGGYPGFKPFPYREYSEVFFDGGYRVLRGASWATRSRVARVTFRNWDHPHRRQIFAGFRCARDA